MRIDGQPYRSIWRDMAGTVKIIDQTLLPHRFCVIPLSDMPAAAHAIKAMQVRGAPLIGAGHGAASSVPSDLGTRAARVGAARNVGGDLATSAGCDWTCDST